MHLTRTRTVVTRVGALLGAGVLATSALVASPAAQAAANPGFVLYSAQGYDSAAVQAFNATHPGFTVTLNDNSTGPLLQQIQAEGNNPKWGALWVDGATAFAQLDLKHMLAQHVVPSVSFNKLGRANIPADGSFVPTGLTVVGGLCYDSSQVSANQLPSTWAQLAEPQYQGLGMNDPSQSGPTYPMIAGVMDYLGKYHSGSTAHAVAAGKAFFSSLYRNGLTVNQTNGPTIAAMEGQQISMAIIQSSACYAHELTDFPTMRVKYLDMSVALPGVFGIDAKMPKIVQADAKKFLDWLLTKPGQHAMQTGDPTGDSLYWPVLNGIAPANKIIPSLASTHAISIDPYVWGPLETSVNTWFDNTIVNG